MAPMSPACQQGVDLMRVIAAHLIVLHHLAIYTGMAEAAWALAPDVLSALANDARKVVQVFLVIGGLLAARSLMPGVGLEDRLPRTSHAPTMTWALRAVAARYLRLMPMLLLAVALVLVVAWLVEVWVGVGEGDGATRTGVRLLVHLLLLQDVLGVPSFSAGLWYVAIDLQLYACAVVLSWWALRPSHDESRYRGLRASGWLHAGMLRTRSNLVLWVVVVMVLLSAWVFNRDARGDAFAPYFMVPYGLGMLAWWAGRSAAARAALLAATVGVAAALMVDFRDRLLLALLTAWVLVALLRWRLDVQRDSRVASVLRRQAGATYALFLLHYPVLLLVDAWWSTRVSASPLMALTGLIVTWFGARCLALLVHAWVEPQLMRVARLVRP